MAVTATATDLSCIVVWATDETKNGKAVTASQSFSNINVAATDAQVLAFGTAIGALKSGDLDSVNKTEKSTLSESE